MKFVPVLHKLLAVALMAATLVIAPSWSAAQPVNRAGEIPVLILVRHADKASQPADDPALTAAGAKRAQDLAGALRTAGVTAIITTQLNRTRATAQPLATELGIVPEIVSVGERALVSNPTADAKFPAEVIAARAEYVRTLEQVVRRHSGVVLVVGHDWSAPGLIAALGGPQLPNICSSVYDNMFILTSVQGKTNLIRTRYGAPTPDTDCK